MVWNPEAAGRLGAIGIACVVLVGIAAPSCGADDDVTEDNIRPKFVAAFCEAEARCCASQGFPLSADGMLLCQGVANAAIAQGNGSVFRHEFAVECLKAAQAYQCRGRSDIDTLCNNVY